MSFQGLEGLQPSFRPCLDLWRSRHGGWMKRVLRKNRNKLKSDSPFPWGGKTNEFGLTASVCFHCTTKISQSEGLQTASLACDGVGHQFMLGSAGWFFPWRVQSCVCSHQGDPRRDGSSLPCWSVTLKRLISSLFTGLLGRDSRQCKSCLFS